MKNLSQRRKGAEKRFFILTLFIVHCSLFIVSCDNNWVISITDPLFVKELGATVSKPVVTNYSFIDPNNVDMEFYAEILPANGQSVEYSVSVFASASASDLTWDFSNTRVVDIGTTYYIYARSAENKKNYAGGSGVSDAVLFHAVYFDGNENTGGAPPATKVSLNRESVILPNEEPLVKTHHRFTGWNTQADGSGVNYNAGGLFSPSANAMLYAQWESTLGSIDVIIIDIDPIADEAKILGDTLGWTYNSAEGYYDSGIVLSIASGIYEEITVIRPPSSSVTEIRWEIQGAGAYEGEAVSGTGNSFTIMADRNDPEHIKYCTVGSHFLRLFVTADGKEYMVNIRFEITN